MTFKFVTCNITLLPCTRIVSTNGKLCEDENGMFIWSDDDETQSSFLNIKMYDLIITPKNGEYLGDFIIPRWYKKYYLSKYNDKIRIDEIIIKFKTYWSEKTLLQMDANNHNPDEIEFTARPMLNEDGTIQIKIVDNVSFNSSEIGDILERYRQHAWKHGLTKTGLKKWIKNNQ